MPSPRRTATTSSANSRSSPCSSRSPASGRSKPGASWTTSASPKVAGYVASAPSNDRPCSNSWADALIIVISGPGGVGKGAIVDALLERDPNLWLSRSWTTRSRRPGEPADAYVFATREAFEARIAEGGFLEWTDFLGSYYGTPTPTAPPGSDVVLEIEVQGAQQIRSRYPDALLIFVLPPSREEQQRRLQGRGDTPDTVAARLRNA